MNIAFAGFRHGHIFDLWNKAKNNSKVNITGSWESDEKTRAVCIRQGVEFNYPDYEAILNDKRVDTIAIGDYYGARGSLAIMALEAGKHIIADKPLCTSLDELETIKRLSRENSLSVYSMFSMRYEANAASVRDIILSNKLGEIRSLYFGGQHPLNYGSRPMWYFEEGKHGGTINDIGIHGIDFIKYTMGLRFAKILSARCWNAFAKEKPDFKDSAQFMLELNNGAGVIADVSYASPDSFSYGLPTYWLFIVWGSKGMLKFNAGTGDVEAYFEGSSNAAYIKGTAPQADYLTDMIAEIKGDTPKVLSTAEVLSSTGDILSIQHFADKSDL
ncbi:MAG: Gfo/Idh/MocA family protein [Eubacteriales bacterium]